MTDTPRTRAELLTDFANNQNHGITAQKMRNLVESIATPVREDVLDPVKMSTDTTLQIFTNVISGTNRPKAGATGAGSWSDPIQVGVTLTQMRDQLGVWQNGVVYDWASGPDAWIDKDYHIDAANPRNSYGGYGLDLDSAFMLPPGVFDVYVYAVFTPAIDWGQSFSRNVQLYFDQAEWDGGAHSVPQLQADLHNHVPGAWYEAFFNPLFTYYQSPAYATAPTNWTNYQAASRVINDAESPMPFVLLTYQKDVTHDTFFTVVGVDIVKLK
jgi:hypothetical protein